MLLLLLMFTNAHIYKYIHLSYACVDNADWFELWNYVFKMHNGKYYNVDTSAAALPLPPLHLKSCSYKYLWGIFVKLFTLPLNVQGRVIIHIHISIFCVCVVVAEQYIPKLGSISILPRNQNAENTWCKYFHREV